MKDYMKKIVFSAGLTAFVLLGAGCSSKQEIEGEAFIDLRGSASKLALVDIQIVPESQFISHIKSQLPKAEAEVQKLSKKKSEEEAELSQLQARADSLIKGPSAILLMATSVVASINRNIQSLTSEIDAQSSGASLIYYTGKIDGAIFATSTNSDGKFKLSLETGKKVALVAVKDNRLAWALWLTPSKSKPTITLSNKNLSGSNCDECIFNAKVTPKSLELVK